MADERLGLAGSIVSSMPSNGYITIDGPDGTVRINKTGLNASIDIPTAVTADESSITKNGNVLSIKQNGVTPVMVAFIQPGKNKFNKFSDIIPNGFFDNTTGNQGSNSGALCFKSLVKPSTIYVRQGHKMNSYVHFFGINKNWLSVIDLTGVFPADSFTTPSNCYYVGWNIQWTGYGNGSENDVQLELGTITTPYKPFGYYIANSDRSIVLEVPLIKNADLDPSFTFPSVTIPAGSIHNSNLASDFVFPPAIGDEVVIHKDSNGIFSLLTGGINADKTNFLQSGKNKFNKYADMNPNHFYDNINGSIGSSAGACCLMTAVKPSTQYTRSGHVLAGPGYIHFFTSAKTWISVYSSGATFTTPSNCYYVGFNIQFTGYGNDSENDVQIEQGSAATAYEAFGYTISDPTGNVKLAIPTGVIHNSNLAGDFAFPSASITGDEVIIHVSSGGVISIKDSSIPLSKVTFTTAGKNKFNKALAVIDELLNNANGARSPLTGFCWTGFIEVLPNTQYTQTNPTPNYGAYIHFYDASYAWLSCVAISGTTTFTTPANTKYIARNLASNSGNITAAKNTYQVELGAAATSYEDYGLTLDFSKFTLPSGVVHNSNLASDFVFFQSVPSIKEKIRVLKDVTSGAIYVRSYFNETQDVVIKYPSKTFLITKATPDTATDYEAGTVIQSSTDDIPPWTTINCGHIGGGHGYNTQNIVHNAHGKDNTDVGSIWTDGVHNFYLAQVVDANNLIFSCVPYSYSGSWAITAPVATLTHVSGAVHTGSVSITSQFLVQQLPIYKNNTETYLVDNTGALTPGTVAYAENFDIIVYQELTDPSTLTFQNPMVWNSGNTWVKEKIIYRFQNNGAMLIFWSAEVVRPMNLNWKMDVMLVPLIKGAYNKIFLYMPKVLVNDSHDLQAIADFTNNFVNDLSYTDGYIIDTTKPPERIVEFLGDTDGTKRVGYALGHVYTQGLGRPALLAANCVMKWLVANTGKMYPQLLNGTGVIAGGQCYNAISYRQAFDPQLFPGTTAVYFHRIGNYDLVYIDVHSTQTNLKVMLPEKYIGKTITVVEKSSSVTLVSDDAVTSNGIILNVTTYGYCILKLI
jgi:hypothetical protein